MFENPIRRSLVIACISSWLAGCSPTTTPEANVIHAARSLVLVNEMPGDVISIEAAKTVATSPTSVTVRGRIDAGEFDPFDTDRAAFLMLDVEEDDHATPDHDASNCPFCKRKAALALRSHVVIVDQQGVPFTIHASKLLGLAKGDRVVVHGLGQWDEALEMLSVQAERIHVVR